MKKALIILISISSLFSISGCEKYVSQDDIDPNGPTHASLQTLLPVVEVSIFATYTGEMARTSNCWVQQFTGTQFQLQEYSNYSISENDVQNDWTTIYNAGIVNANEIISDAGSTNAYYYKGIGEVCKAMILGIATDFWGDIPNTEAGLGEANLTPHYDSQESVIASIQTLLSDAIVNLKTSAVSNSILPGTDDLIHSGDVAAWIKTAWILKARYHNRLSKRLPGSSATDALADVDNAIIDGLTGNADNANTIFDGSANLNTWYDFNNTRADYIHAGKTLVDYMNGTSDPRVPFYFSQDGGGNYTGTATGDIDISTSNIGSFYGDPVSPLPMVTYVELRYIEAEAALRAGNTSRAQTAYTDALMNAMALYPGIDAVAVTSYLAANGTLSTDLDSAYMQIMTQKWVSMYTQPEAFADWRRTVSTTHPSGVPALAPSPSGVITTIPVRYPTEQNERLYNPNAVVISNLTSHVWWDQ